MKLQSCPFHRGEDKKSNKSLRRGRIMSQWSLGHGHVKGHCLNTTAVCSSFVPSDTLQVHYKRKVVAVGWKFHLNVSVFFNTWDEERLCPKHPAKIDTH